MAKRKTSALDDTGWVKVASSNVRMIRHQGAPVNTLFVKFADGSRYAYFNVPRDVYRRMLNSASKGQFVHRVLSAYEYEKVYVTL